MKNLLQIFLKNRDFQEIKNLTWSCTKICGGTSQINQRHRKIPIQCKTQLLKWKTKPWLRWSLLVQKRRCPLKKQWIIGSLMSVFSYLAQMGLWSKFKILNLPNVALEGNPWMAASNIYFYRGHGIPLEVCSTFYWRQRKEWSFPIYVEGLLIKVISHDSYETS